MIAESFKRFLITRLTERLLSTKTSANSCKKQSSKFTSHKLQCQLLSGKTFHLKRQIYSAFQARRSLLIEDFKSFAKKVQEIGLVDSDNFIKVIGGKRLHNSLEEAFYHETTYFTLGNDGRILKNEDHETRFEKILQFDENGLLIKVLRESSRSGENVNELWVDETGNFIDQKRLNRGIERCLQVNDFGVVTNLFNAVENVSKDKNPKANIVINESGFIETKDKASYWECSDICNVRERTIFKVIAFINQAAKASDSVLNELLTSDFDVCSYKNKFCQKSIVKLPSDDSDFEVQVLPYLGHFLYCSESEECQSYLRAFRELASHYSGIRTILSKLYSVRALLNALSTLTDEIDHGDFESLQNVIPKMRKIVETRGLKMSNAENEAAKGDESDIRPCLDESEILAFYNKQFARAERDINEFHDTSCDCCARLLKNSDLRTVEKLGCTSVFDNHAFLILRAGLLLKNPDFREMDMLLCPYCSKELRKGKVPIRCFLNGLGVDVPPTEVTSLNMFEKALIQLVKAFHTVVRLGTKTNSNMQFGAVKALKGRIIYLPIPVQKNLDMIPAALPKDHELHVLVNGLPTSDKKVWQKIVRLDALKKAVAELKKINPLYKDIDITQINEDYIYGTEEINETIEHENSLTPDELMAKTDPLALLNNLDEVNTNGFTTVAKNPQAESHQIDIDVINDGVIESNLSPDDRYKILTQPEALLRKLSKDEVTELYDHYTIHPVNVQPSKDVLGSYQMKRVEAEPISNWDKNLEYMSFVHLFPMARYGKHDERPFGKITETEYRLSRLLNANPMFRRDYAFMFHLYQEAEMKSINSSLNYVLRVKKPMNVSVNNFVNQVESRDSELESNLATFMGHIRGTKDYWYKVLKCVLAMIREYGPPTWLLTFNPAEYDDIELHDHLRRVNADVPGIESMSVAELLNLDPLSVSLHFHNKVRSLLNNFVLCKENPVLGPIAHHFVRVEYQSRGLAHYHCLLWAEEAPMIGSCSAIAILEYVQKYVTCSIPKAAESPELYRLIKKFQTHKCCSSCYRKVKRGNKELKVCRYGFPRNVTNVATLNSVESVTRHRKMKRGQKRLYDLPRNENEVFINDYNPALLLALKANMDLQFVADSSEQVAIYVTSYVTKGDRAEMDQCFAELAHESLSKRLFAYGLKSFTNKSVGIYEALDMMLGQKLFQKSDTTKFINTNVKENRAKVLKCYKDLARLREIDPESEDICQKGFVDDKYPNRPDSLEDLSLREFGRFYDYVKYSEGAKKSENVIELKNNLGFMRKRIKPYIIEHYVHDPIEEPEKYCHALLILFKPWRNETELLGEFATFTEAFESSLSTLKPMREYHEKFSVSKEVLKKRKASEKAKEIAAISDAESYDDENALQGKEIVVETENAMHDVEAAMEIDFEGTALDQVALLNTDQKRVYDKVMDHFTQEGGKIENFCHFVSGPGGTGKSFLIATIANAVRRHFKNAGSVAIAAPTGLAALNVNGVTLHRLLMLPVEHGRTAEYHSLNSENISIMKQTLGNLKLLIVDEISMVSSVLLTYVHLRLNEFWEMNKPFGGVVCVLVFGDFFQLPPVQGNPAFLKVTSQEARLRFNSIGGTDLWKYFRYDELTQNVRQADDRVYGDLLNRIRVGTVTKDDVSTLESRLVTGGNKIQVAMNLYLKLVKEGFHPICLMPKLAMCDKFNIKMLEESRQKVECVQCEDKLVDYDKKITKNIVRRLKMLDNEPSKTGGLESKLYLCVGSRIMVRRNINFEEGVINGTMAIITGFQKNDSGNITGIRIRVDREPSDENNKPDFLVEKISVKFLLMTNLYVKRTQFPIILAYAITIHKSQGMSLKCAIMDLGSNLFGTGMAYVALSRVTSLAGLHLLQLDPNKITADGRAIAEYNRLRQKHRPDLPLIEIVGSEGKRGTKRPTSRCILEVEGERSDETLKERPNKKIRLGLQSIDIFPLKGFQNGDGVTCYANSVLQLLLLIPELRNIIKEHKGSLSDKPILTCLRNTIEHVENSNESFSDDGFNLRTAVGLPFTHNEQQDASEFLWVLLPRLCEEMETPDSNALRELLWTKSQNVTKCPSCHLEKSSGNFIQSCIFTLPLPNLCKIDWKLLVERMRPTMMPCETCKRREIDERDVLISAGKYVFLWFPRDTVVNGHPIKILTKISGFENQKVVLNHSVYKTRGVIIHKGSSLNQGHYLNFIRKDNSWYEVSDTTITKRDRFVSNLTDVSIILLEKVSLF